MSEESVEIVRGLFDAWNRRDLESALALTSPTVVYVNAPHAVEPGTRHGQDAFSAVLRKQWDGLGASARFDIERIEDRGDEVLVVSRTSRGLPGSSVRIDNSVLTRWTVRNGRIVRIEALGGGSALGDALRAAGLSE